MNTSIPNNIFQTNRSQKYVDSNPRLKAAQNSWKKQKGFKYHFFDDDQMDKFIKDNFDESVNKAYHRCPMMVMKADLWRYCVIYIHGGIYADSDTVRNEDMSEFVKHDVELVMFSEVHDRLCQWLFAAPPKSPILKSIIDESVKRLLEIPEIKGEHIIHFTTGPNMFTSAIEEYIQSKNIDIFKNKEDYIKLPKNSYVFAYPHKHVNGKLTKHLFSGQWKDGWYKERFRKLM